jgi:flagellar biosynthesis/type III secretory pathway protein FliH
MAGAKHLHVRLPWRPTAVRVAGEGEAAAGAAARAVLEGQRERLVAAAAALERAAAEVERLAADFRSRAEGQLADLALAIARAVLLQEVKAGRYEIDPIVAEAVGRMGGAGKVVVRLSKADYEACAAAREKLGAGRVEYVADAGMAPASCVVEAAGGVLEYSVDAALEAAGKAMKG